MLAGGGKLPSLPVIFLLYTIPFVIRKLFLIKISIIRVKTACSGPVLWESYTVIPSEARESAPEVQQPALRVWQ